MIRVYPGTPTEHAYAYVTANDFMEALCPFSALWMFHDIRYSKAFNHTDHLSFVSCLATAGTAQVLF